MCFQKYYFSYLKNKTIYVIRTTKYQALQRSYFLDKIKTYIVRL